MPWTAALILRTDLPWLACCKTVLMIWNATLPCGGVLSKTSLFWWKGTMVCTWPLPELFLPIPVTVLIELRCRHRPAEKSGAAASLLTTLTDEWVCYGSGNVAWTH
jgi:hypothetical protein